MLTVVTPCYFLPTTFCILTFFYFIPCYFLPFKRYWNVYLSVYYPRRLFISLPFSISSLGTFHIQNAIPLSIYLSISENDFLYPYLFLFHPLLLSTIHSKRYSFVYLSVYCLLTKTTFCILTFFYFIPCYFLPFRRNPIVSEVEAPAKQNPFTSGAMALHQAGFILPFTIEYNLGAELSQAHCSIADLRKISISSPSMSG